MGISWIDAAEVFALTIESYQLSVVKLIGKPMSPKDDRFVL